MPAKVPTLDSRALADIMDELRQHARASVPEWNPPAEGDAGTMLHRIFARLLELALQRLNRVPEKNLLAFLDAMGVSLLPPAPASVPLTFSLTAGTPPTLVPRGTQVLTKPKGQEPAIDFETAHDLTVVPAELVSAFTIDPVWDRYSDHTLSIRGEKSFPFTPFVGIKQAPHVLYIGDDILLNFTAPAKVEIKLSDDQLSQTVRDLFSTLVWQCSISGSIRTIVPSFQTFRFTLSGTIDEDTLQGVGLNEPITSRWLRGMLPSPFADATARGLQLEDLHLKVSGENLAPDIALTDNSVIDLTKEVLPFGNAPTVGQAFYVASRDALSKPGAMVTLNVTLKESVHPTLVWEYWDGESRRWKLVTSVLDDTKAFTQKGLISLLMPAPFGNFSGVLLRVRITGGEYRGFPSITKFNLITTAQLTNAVGKGGEMISVDRADFTAAPRGSFVSFYPLGDQLLIEPQGLPPELLTVFDVQKNNLKTGPSQNNYQAGTTVKIPKWFIAEPIATLSSAAALNDTIVALTISPLMVVNPPLASGNILKISDPEHPEFVVVKNITRQDLQQRPIGFETTAPLSFPHDARVTLSRVTSNSDFFRLSGEQLIDFERSFSPFGESPSQTNVFYFGTSSGVTSGRATGAFGGGDSGSTMRLSNLAGANVANLAPGAGGLLGTPFLIQPFVRINLEVEANVVPQDVDLAWEYLGAEGWRPITVASESNVDQDTVRLRNGGSRRLFLSNAQCVLGEVGGKKNYWIRARIARGNYGLPVGYVEVVPEDPSKGFKVKPGTGNLNPPVISKLTLNYEAERSPTLVTKNGFFFRDQTNTTFKPFSSLSELTQIYADTEPAFYLGFDAAFPEQPVNLYVIAASRSLRGNVLNEGRSDRLIAPALELHWEYVNGSFWRSLNVFDDTNNLFESGSLQFLTPIDIRPLARFDSTPRYWIRARTSTNNPFNTQQLTGVFLNTVYGIQANTILNEMVGSSNGQPNQKLRLAHAPVLPGNQLMVKEPEPPSDQERTAIEFEEGFDAIQQQINSVTQEAVTWVRWHEVPNFLASDPQSRHYTLDRVSGSLGFGDGKRGLIPPSGTNSVVATYQTGGGSNGNRPKGAVAQIKSSLPGVSGVTNGIPTDGGADVESIEMVKERGPHVVKHRNHAVTAADLEWLSRQAAGTSVARAKCLPNVNRDLQFEPGCVTLLIVPRDVDAKLSPSSELIREVENYVTERAFIGLTRQTPSRVNVIGAGYIQIVVHAKVVPKRINEAQAVKHRVLSSLMTFLHPLSGGRFGSGWEFGRDVYASEVSELIESIAGVDHVESLRLVPNVVQRRLSVEPFAAPFDLPNGTGVISRIGSNAALLAERVATGNVSELAVTGVKQGDRITKVLDVQYQGGSDLTIDVETFFEPFRFPAGSMVRSFDGTVLTRLTKPTEIDRAQKSITVERKVDGLIPGDRLTVFYPFPMTIASVRDDELNPSDPGAIPPIGIEPYEPQYPIDRGSRISTLDGRVRMVLLENLSPGDEVTSISLNHFVAPELVLLDRSGREVLSTTIRKSSVIDDVVYVSEYSLAYSGAHQITMLWE